jgi:hypothetical protein
MASVALFLFWFEASVRLTMVGHRMSRTRCRILLEALSSTFYDSGWAGSGERPAWLRTRPSRCEGTSLQAATSNPKRVSRPPTLPVDAADWIAARGREAPAPTPTWSRQLCVMPRRRFLPASGTGRGGPGIEALGRRPKRDALSRSEAPGRCRCRTIVQNSVSAMRRITLSGSGRGTICFENRRPAGVSAGRVHFIRSLPRECEVPNSRVTSLTVSAAPQV